MVTEAIPVATPWRQADWTSPHSWASLRWRRDGRHGAGRLDMSDTCSAGAKAATIEARPRHDGLAEAIEQGYTLPADWYTDPATFAREQRRIFRRAWQFVALAEDLPDPGDFITR